MSSDFLSGLKSFTSPPKPPTIDPAEFLALYSLVQTLVAINAAEAGNQRGRINEIAGWSSEAVLKAASKGDIGHDRANRAVEAIHKLLASIEIAKGNDPQT